MFVRKPWMTQTQALKLRLSPFKNGKRVSKLGSVKIRRNYIVHEDDLEPIVAPLGASPYNWFTQETYTNKLVISLLLSRNFENAAWVTAKQVHENGWHVPSDSLGVDVPGEDETLFNLDQLERVQVERP